MIRKLLHNNGLWSLLSSGAAALIGFINLAMVIRHHSKAEAGNWLMLLTVYTLLEMLRTGLVQTPYIRYYTLAPNTVGRARLTGAAWHLLVPITLAMSVISFMALWLLPASGHTWALSRHAIAPLLLASLPYQLMLWQLQARQQFKKLAIARLAVPTALLVMLVMEGRAHLSITRLANSWIFIQLLAGCLGAVSGWLQFGKLLGNLKHQRRKLFAFGKYSMVTMVASALLRGSDQLIIAVWLGPAAVAAYGVPQKLMEAIEIPVRALSVLAIPASTKMWQQSNLRGLRSFFFRQCGKLFVLVMPVLIIFFLFPGYVVALMGSAKYTGSTLLLQIFCFYAALLPVDRYLGVFLDASNQPRKNTLKVIVMLATNLFFDWLALQLGWGLVGVAAGSTLTFLAGVIMGWLQLKDILNVRQPAFTVSNNWPAPQLLSGAVIN